MLPKDTKMLTIVSVAVSPACNSGMNTIEHINSLDRIFKVTSKFFLHSILSYIRKEKRPNISAQFEELFNIPTKKSGAPRWTR